MKINLAQPVYQYQDTTFTVALAKFCNFYFLNKNVHQKNPTFDVHIMFNLSPTGGATNSMPPTPGYGEDDCYVFNGVTYLGSASVNAPRSEVEINRNMTVINEQSQMAIDVALHVPMTSEGTVR